jgi:hypothetical protein
MCGLDESVPLTPEYSERREKRAGRGKDDFIPGTFKLKRNPSNDHMIDRALQKKTFTGIVGVASQDIGIQEGMGPIFDRSKEILFASDAAIVAMRRLLLDATRAVERGDDPPGLDPSQCRNVRGYDCIVPNDVNDWKSYMYERLGPKW